MKLERIENKNVVVPENELDREILRRLLFHMRPDDTRHWDVANNSYERLDNDDTDAAEDRQGRMYVSWEGEDLTRHLDPFSICKSDDGGYLHVVKMSVRFK